MTAPTRVPCTLRLGTAMAAGASNRGEKGRALTTRLCFVITHMWLGTKRPSLQAGVDANEKCHGHVPALSGQSPARSPQAPLVAALSSST